MSIRWVIAMVTLFLIATLVSNILEAHAGYTTEQMSQVNTMRDQSFVESKNTGGGLAVTGINPVSAVVAIWKSLTLEYSFLYNIYSGITEGQCTVLYNGQWQTATSTCKVPNVWFLPFFILLWGPIVAVGVYLILTIVHGT